MKKRTLKKLSISLLIYTVIISAGVIYLNEFFLPIKIKDMVVSNLERAIQKKVSLETLRFNIFKGLVLKNLAIYDEAGSVISLKEASCTFLILPILKEKKIIIPNIRLVEPEIFLERKADNTINLLGLLPKEPANKSKSKFSILVLKINIAAGRIKFRDSAISPTFTKNLENISLNLSFTLPSGFKFNLKSSIPAKPAPITLNVNGEFKIPDKQLSALLRIGNFNPAEFSAYYQNLGDIIKEGTFNPLIKVDLKNDILNTDLECDIVNLVVVKDKILSKLNSALKANLQYGLEDKKLSYSGTLNITRLDVSGLEKIEKIENLNGIIRFNQEGLNSDPLNLNILGLAFQGKFNLTNFASPSLSLDLLSELDLNIARKTLSEKLKIASLPLDLQGKGKLSLSLETKLPLTGIPKINGSLDLSNAQARLDNIKDPFTNISGRINFNLNGLAWEKFSADYLGETYSSNGSLKNFNSPDIVFALTAKDLSLESELNIKDKLINMKRLRGRYINSDFAAEGSIDSSSSDSTSAKITLGINLDLRDLKKSLDKFKDVFEKVKPNGILNTELNIEGNIRDFRKCLVKAKFSSPSLSLYGLKTGDFFMSYNQIDGIGDIPLMHLSLYDGAMEVTAKINLSSENFPYWISIFVNGLKIEKLKNDTPLKDKDIAGTIQAEMKLNGFSGDLSKLSGAGKIAIANGKLWQLNLFKGIGELLFTKDFADIVFSEGYCEFFIKDKAISSENFKLKSNLVALAGSGSVGFDSSLDASINVKMSDEMIPLGGTIRDVTTALIGEAGRFAVIKLSGTLKEPKYKFQPAVVDVIKGLKDFVIGNIFGK